MKKTTPMSRGAGADRLRVNCAGCRVSRSITEGDTVRLTSGGSAAVSLFVFLDLRVVLAVAISGALAAAIRLRAANRRLGWLAGN